MEIYIDTTTYRAPEGNPDVPCPVRLSAPYPHPIPVTIELVPLDGGECASVHACVHMCMCAACKRVCVCACMRGCGCVHVCVCAYVYVCIYVCASVTTILLKSLSQPVLYTKDLPTCDIFEFSSMPMYIVLNEFSY